MNVEMVEKVENLDEIIVSARVKAKCATKWPPLVASFSVAETENMPKLGRSFTDGVQFCRGDYTNDSRNDIIIRGNYRLVCWETRWVSIPNPNHFGALGTTTVPSMLNNNVLTNSDFSRNLPAYGMPIRS